MPKFIIINGPCGVGKSTVASALHETMPLSVKIEADELARWIHGYRLPENRDQRKVTSNAMVLSLLDTCLREGHDVIIEKMQFDQTVLDTQIEVAKRYHAEVLELILWAPKEIVMARAHDRGWREGGSLTPEKCEIFWQKIDEMKDQRPSAVVVDTSNMTIEDTVSLVRGLVNRAAP